MSVSNKKTKTIMAQCQVTKKWWNKLKKNIEMNELKMFVHFQYELFIRKQRIFTNFNGKILI